MALRFGLGFGLGTVRTNSVPADDVNAPTSLITGASAIIVSGAEAVGAFDALTIITSKTCQQMSVADVGITIATGVTAWTDASGLTRPWAQGVTASTQPLWTQNDATLNNRGTIRFNGTSNFLGNAWNPPSTATTPTFYRIIAKHISRTASNATLIGSAVAHRFGVFDSAASPNVHGCGVSVGTDTAMTLGVWYVVDLLMGNAASDYLHIGSAKPTGSLGSIDPTSISLGAVATGASAFGNYDVAAVFTYDGEPSGAELTAWNAQLAKYYGPNLVLPT